MHFDQFLVSFNCKLIQNWQKWQKIVKTFFVGTIQVFATLNAPNMLHTTELTSEVIALVKCTLLEWKSETRHDVHVVFNNR